MVREVGVQAIVEQFQQILECQIISFIPGCADSNLRHPLLDFLPVACLCAAASEKRSLESVWRDEHVRALCDLAMQSGRMEELNACRPLTECWQMESIAALPLECPAGTLGVFLLADERPRSFGPGVEHLLHGCLSMRRDHLEKALWQQAWIAVLESGGQQDREESGPSCAPGGQLRDEFVSMVGHELRVPLSIIKGYAGLLQIYGGADGQQDQILTPERQRQYLDAIMEQTNLLEILVTDLLDISRIQRGKLALRPRAVDVEALCQQIVRSGQVRADQYAPGKHRLEAKLSSLPYPIWVDAGRLQQILINILENAIKYSPEGGRIEMEVRLLESHEKQIYPPDGQRSPAQICITIRDQGIGIPTRHSAQLFQPFQRLEQPAAAQITGMGLGLYITRKLVEAMGGSIDLQSCEGSGTNVTIILPAVKPGEAVTPETVAQVSLLPVG